LAFVLPIPAERKREAKLFAFLPRRDLAPAQSQSGSESHKPAQGRGARCARFAGKPRIGVHPHVLAAIF
jgi:hypothetical protein